MTQSPKVESLRTLRRLVGRFSPVRRAAAGVFVLLAARTALEILVPLLVGESVKSLEGHHESLPGRFVQLVWLLAGVLVLRALVHYLSQVAATRVGQDLENRLRADLFAHITRLRFTYHDKNRSGKTIAHSLRDMEKTKRFFREVWFGYLEIALIVVAVVVMTFFVHWSYGLVVGGLFCLAIAGTVLIAGRIAGMDRGVSDLYDEVTNVLQENVAGARVVRAFGRERFEVGRFGSRMDKFTGAWGRLERFWTTVFPWIGHIYHLVMPCVLLVGAWRVSTGAGTIGEVVIVLLYVRTVHHRIRPLTRLVIVGQQALASASRVFSVLDHPDVIRPPAKPATLPARGGDLRIKQVTFAYAGGEDVLRGVSLHLPPGGSLGLLGTTGAGKSTLMAMLPRFYDPDQGCVRLDGIDLRELDVPDLRRQVGLVFQEPFLFSATVAQNIAYGGPDLSRERLEECVRLAEAQEFVAALPEGYDTVIGERGVSLSGGQRQRLTIARALAMDPRLLIFDDATSAVDAVTERRLFANIRAAAEGRTTLVVSQRVTSVSWCDRIAVLEKGCVTAVGTHGELVGTSALYREICLHQELKEVAR